ncbi:ABC transporter permease [Vibrio astriarenae]|uniref:ABC transporter permease n=1 Tax=Vibrio astriarenae TaxID=1481923 RepID=A0A7Z2T3U6_9VIBR|nr:ABC transporter permease [Vibrio astriarenae]QIA63765.1 ABC transporter permease [Vibrio astriarenae]
MSFWSLLKEELVALLTNPVVVITVFGGVVFYSFLYPLPYAHQTPLEQKVAVVNLDNSQVSLKLERMIDATPQVQVVERVHTIEDAKTSFMRGDISGFIVIPAHFYKDLLLGKSPVLSYAGDASYFLVYGTVVEGLAQAGGTLGAEVKVAQILSSGEPIALASEQYSSVKSNLKPTFNPRMGYVDYVVPAVFVLILQQTLVMAAGLMVGTQKGNNGYWQQVSKFKLLAARTFVLSFIYYVLSMYYFGASFNMHGVTTLASMSHILTMLLPFIVACCLLGYTLGYWLPRRELVTVLVLVSSMPLVFLAGFIWPVEMIPAPLLWAADLFPSTVAIKAFLSLNQMGADWSQVNHLYTHLWILVLSWGCVTAFVSRTAPPSAQSAQSRAVKTT